MIEIVKIFIESDISTLLKIIIALSLFGLAVWNVVGGISFILSLVYDYKDKKDLSDLDEYVDFSHHK